MEDDKWERLSQIEKIMKSNKPVKVKEYKPFSMWEKSVQDYLERDKKRWERRKQK